MNTVEGMKRVAYYKGCLASSAKELDTSTQALSPRVEIAQPPLRDSLAPPSL